MGIQYINLLAYPSQLNLWVLMTAHQNVYQSYMYLGHIY